MNQVTIQVPAYLHLSAFEVGMLLATRLFEEGKLSSGQAAEMVGLSKRAFIELLGKYGVSVFGYGFEEIQADMKNV
jgi:predicted HTH domain antitoxin